ncbi:MAG: hypothetical protein OSA93_01670, partial [Akkermansiaceae bacterium]|nr:hypothetical protein [Akkermansiaceae bacterium]
MASKSRALNSLVVGAHLSSPDPPHDEFPGASLINPWVSSILSRQVITDLHQQITGEEIPS